MKTFLLDYPENYSSERVGIYNKSLSPDQYIFYEGKPITEEVPKIVIECDFPKEFIESLGLLPSTAGSPIIRNDVLEICTNLFENQIQTFDVEVHTENGILNNYKLINILNVVDAVDLNESICKYLTDKKTIRGFYCLVFKENSLGNLHIARLKESPSHIIVSEILKEQLYEYKIEGARFIEPQEFYGELYDLQKTYLANQSDLSPRRSLNKNWNEDHRASIVAKEMDDIVIYGEKGNWTKEQYNKEFMALLQNHRALLKKANAIDLDSLSFIERLLYKLKFYINKSFLFFRLG